MTHVAKKIKCVHCGAESIAEKPFKKYCSSKCRVYASRARKRVAKLAAAYAAHL